MIDDWKQWTKEGAAQVAAVLKKAKAVNEVNREKESPTMAAKKTVTALVCRGGVVSVEEVSTELKAMQKLVGVSLRGPWNGMSMWVDETGRLTGKEVRAQPFYPGPIAGDWMITRLSRDGARILDLEALDIVRAKQALVDMLVAEEEPS